MGQCLPLLNSYNVICKEIGVAGIIQPYTLPSYIGNSNSSGVNVELKNNAYFVVFNQDINGSCLYSIYKRSGTYSSIKLSGNGNAIITINGNTANIKGGGDYGGHGFIVGV